MIKVLAHIGVKHLVSLLIHCPVYKMSCNRIKFKGTHSTGLLMCSCCLTGYWIINGFWMDDLSIHILETVKGKDPLIMRRQTDP